MSKELRVKLLADWKDRKSMDVNDIFKEIAEELEYKNTFEGAIEELKKAAESAATPLAEALVGLSKAINEQLPSSDEAAAALTNFYRAIDGNGKTERYSHAEGHQSLATGSQAQAIGSLKKLGREKETYAPSHEPIEIIFEEKELFEETKLNDWYDSFLNSL